MSAWKNVGANILLKVLLVDMIMLNMFVIACMSLLGS